MSIIRKVWFPVKATSLRAPFYLRDGLGAFRGDFFSSFTNNTPDTDNNFF